VKIWLFALMCVLPISTGCGSGSVSFGSIGAIALRQGTDHAVLPDYPKESFIRGVQGRVVAGVRYNSAGVVTGVRILEAPDGLLGDAVEAAVRQWRFRPQRNRHGESETAGRLVFYFKNANGQPLVIDAAKELVSAGPSRKGS